MILQPTAINQYSLIC